VLLQYFRKQLTLEDRSRSAKPHAQALETLESKTTSGVVKKVRKE